MNIPNRVTDCDRKNFFLLFENTVTSKKQECFLRMEEVTMRDEDVHKKLEMRLKKMFPDMEHDMNILAVAQGVELDIAYEASMSLNMQCHLGYNNHTLCTQIVPNYVKQLMEGEVSFLLEDLKGLPRTEQSLSLTKKVTDYKEQFPVSLNADDLQYDSIITDDYGKLLLLKYIGKQQELEKHLCNWNSFYDLKNKGWLAFAVPLHGLENLADVPLTRQKAQIYIMSESNYILGEISPEYCRFSKSDIELVYDVKNQYAQKDTMASYLSFAIEKVTQEFAVKSFLIDKKEMESSASLLDLFAKEDRKNRFILEGYLKENASVSIETVIEIHDYNAVTQQNMVISLSSRVSVGTHDLEFRKDSFNVSEFSSSSVQSVVFEEITNNEALLSKYDLENMTGDSLLPTLRLQNIFPPVKNKPLIGGRTEGVGDKAIPIKIARSKEHKQKEKKLPVSR